METPIRTAIELHPARAALVGAIVSALGLSFAYVGGWLTPHRLTPSAIVDTLEHGGVQPGFRRNHAKGVGVRGTFESNGRGARLSKASVFAPGTTPVDGRFALAGGMPFQSDTLQTVRSLALRFTLPGGEEWRTGMNAMPAFVAATPDIFEAQLLATAPDPATGKPDPEKVQAFFEANPGSARAVAALKAQPLASGFANATYRSLNAFFFVAASGRRTPVRWALQPVDAFVAATSLPAGPNALFDALAVRMHQSPVVFHLVVTVGQPDDPTNDATVAWPNDREAVDVGTLTLTTIESEETSIVRSLNFDPLIVPSGIRGSDDPILPARSAAYARSFERRSGEAVKPSAVTAAEVNQ